jgi:hypothetical protein
MRLVIEDYQPNTIKHKMRAEEMEIYARFTAGERLTPEEASRIRPTREHALALWRHINRGFDENGLMKEGFGPMCRRISREQMIPETYGKYLLVLDALRDTENITYTLDQGAVHITLMKGKTLALGRAKPCAVLNPFSNK